LFLNNIYFNLFFFKNISLMNFIFTIKVNFFFFVFIFYLFNKKKKKKKKRKNFYYLVEKKI